MIVLPSIASADQLNIQGEIDRLEGYGWLHLDIEDGNFVPNISFGLKTIGAIVKKYPAIRYDAHLMVTDYDQYIDALAELGISAIAVHLENINYPRRTLAKIRSHDIKAGLAINPKTPIEAAAVYQDRADYFLLMCSEPDNLGDVFMPSILDKAKAIAKLTGKPIIVDGGIKPEIIRKYDFSEISYVVMGRAVFQAQDPRQLIDQINGTPR